MKLTSSGISLISCLLVCVSFISCAGIPSGTVKSALPVTEPGSQPVLQPIDEQVAQPAIEPVVAVKTETPTPQEVNIPKTVFPDISVPPGEKLLYFYPEPSFYFPILIRVFN